MDDATNETPDAAPATPAYVTLGEASRRTGMTKSALSRRIKSGQLSVRERGEDGAFRIDVSELLRFMSTTPVQRAGDTVDIPTSATSDTPLDPAIVTRLAVAEAQLVELRAMLDDLKAERDRWHDQATVALRLLPGPERRRWRWWPRRAG
jgi:hypothetical protein